MRRNDEKNPPDVQMGPALLLTPLAPVAFTGVSPSALERTSGYIARRSRRHPVPSGGWSGAGTFPPVLAVPRSVGPWGPCASTVFSLAEASPHPSTPSRTFPASGNVPSRLFRKRRVHPGIFASDACFQAAQLSPPRRNLPSFPTSFRPCGLSGFGRDFPSR